MRLFVALLLEPSLAAAVAALRAELAGLDRERSVRWVAPEGVHLTLRFLGEVEPARLPPLESGLDRALRDLVAPSLATAELGGFPNLERPRVVWMGVREQGHALGTLAAAMEAAAIALGWQPETRAFQPHLTLGRVREGRRQVSSRLAAALSRSRPPAGPLVQHPRVALVQSHLGPAGARYEELRMWRLESQ